jgi:hypothetical protein
MAKTLIFSFQFPSLLLKPSDYKKVIPLSEKFGFLLAETGYLHIQVNLLVSKYDKVLGIPGWVYGELYYRLN